jgi:hypothetical protein
MRQSRVADAVFLKQEEINVIRSSRSIFALSAGACLLSASLAAVSARAGAPELVVPASERALHVRVDVPADVLPPGDAGQWKLVDPCNAAVVVPAQVACGIAPDGSQSDQLRCLTAVIPSGGTEDAARRFVVQAGASGTPDTAGTFQFVEADERSLRLVEGDMPVLTYNHGTIVAPDVPTTDSRHQRACYIHPLWGLNGEVLTDDFPRDHYHHHGVFWTWPHVKIDGVEYDIWADRGALRQRFVRWLCRETGSVTAVLGVENGWFLNDESLMTERVWTRVYHPQNGTRCVDLELHWVPTKHPVTLWGAGGKSYGGLTVRFAPRDRSSTTITVPSGPTEADLPDTPLVWADFSSRFGQQAEISGAAIFVSPDHPDFPPTWLTRYYGPLCVGWPGVQPQTFEPGQVIRLRYRLWIHDGPVDTQVIQQAYEAFAAATRVTIEETP